MKYYITSLVERLLGSNLSTRLSYNHDRTSLTGYPREMWTHRKIARIVVIGGVRGVQRARSHRAGGCWILLGRLNSRTRRGGLALRGRFLNILSIPKIYKVTKGSPRRRIQRRSRLLKRCFHPRRP